MLSPAKEEVGDGETKGVLKKSSKEDLQHPSTQDDDKQVGHDNKPSETSSYIFPWTFEPKWPLTRAERIWELQQMSSHYESTPQKENVAAAINWHSQFPREQLVPYENVMFQKGKKIDESEFRSEDGQPWEEGCDDEFMTEHAPAAAARASAVKPLQNSRPLPSVQYTHYNRGSSAGGHTYQV